MRKYEEFVDSALEASDPQIAIAHALLAVAAALKDLWYEWESSGLTVRVEKEE